MAASDRTSASVRKSQAQLFSSIFRAFPKYFRTTLPPAFAAEIIAFFLYQAWKNNSIQTQNTKTNLRDEGLFWQLTLTGANRFKKSRFQLRLKPFNFGNSGVNFRLKLRLGARVNIRRCADRR